MRIREVSIFGTLNWGLETTICSSQNARMCLCLRSNFQTSFSYGAGDLMLYVVCRDPPSVEKCKTHMSIFGRNSCNWRHAMLATGKDKVSKNNANIYYGIYGFLSSSIPLRSLFFFAFFTVTESDMFWLPCCRFKHWKTIMRFAKNHDLEPSDRSGPSPRSCTNTVSIEPSLMHTVIHIWIHNHKHNNHFYQLISII